MRNSLLIALNTLKVTFRKKSSFTLIIMPILMIFLSIVVNSKFSDGSIKVAVYLQDKSYVVEDMMKAIEKNEKFKITKVKSEEDLKEKVSDGQVQCGFIIPKDFTENIYNEKPQKVSILSIKGEDTTAWIENYLNFYIDNLMDISKVSKGDKEIFNKIYNGFKKKEIKLEVKKVKDEIQGKNITVQSMGFLVLFMLMSATTTSSLILIDKRRRTYHRILTAPVNAKKYIGGNVIANLVIIGIQCFIVVISMDKIFKVETYLPNIQLFTLLMCFGLVAIGFGMLMVAFSDTTYQASSLSTLVITPTCMLSGCFWPVSLMPDFLKKFSNVFPQRWLLKAIETLQNEQNFKSVLGHVAILLLFALAFFLVSAYKFKNKDNVSKFM